MISYFISDLHLSETRPKLCDKFFNLLAKLKQEQPDSLYILGDFFEVWIGDDEQSALQKKVAEKLKLLSQGGTDIFIIQGNRDFLLGKRYADQCGATLLKDPSLIMLNHQAIVLTHGDHLCTDDKAYMYFRRLVRMPLLQHVFLRLPLRFRQKIANYLRQKSQASMKSAKITDVNIKAVEALAQNNNATLLIHGHTHRAAEHQHPGFTRIVLSDWHDDQGHYLIIKSDGSHQNIYF